MASGPAPELWWPWPTYRWKSCDAWRARIQRLKKVLFVENNKFPSTKLLWLQIWPFHKRKHCSRCNLFFNFCGSIDSRIRPHQSFRVSTKCSPTDRTKTKIEFVFERGCWIWWTGALGCWGVCHLIKHQLFVSWVLMWLICGLVFNGISDLWSQFDSPWLHLALQNDSNNPISVPAFSNCKQ